MRPKYVVFKQGVSSVNNSSPDCNLQNHQLHDDLSNFDALLIEGQYESAASSVLRMGRLVRELVGDTDDCDVRIVKAMRVGIVKAMRA